MTLYETKFATIYFGDERDLIFLNQDLRSNNAFARIQKDVRAKAVVFLKQVHGVDSFFIDSSVNCNELFERQGDALLTDQSNIGIGILTGDCLPVIFIDEKKKGVAIAHAGWRGSVDGIVCKTVLQMQKCFGSQLEDILVYFGPSARSCCYEVQEDFLENIIDVSFKHKLIEKRGKKLFFDVSLLNVLQLLECGIISDNINTKFNKCTMCVDGYHSYRKKGLLAGRQATVIVLH